MGTPSHADHVPTRPESHQLGATGCRSVDHRQMLAPPFRLLGHQASEAIRLRNRENSISYQQEDPTAVRCEQAPPGPLDMTLPGSCVE